MICYVISIYKHHNARFPRLNCGDQRLRDSVRVEDDDFRSDKTLGIDYSSSVTSDTTSDHLAI